MDPTNRPVKVEINGVTARLYFDLNTWDMFEQTTNRNFLDWLNELTQAGMTARKRKMALAAKPIDGDLLTEEEIQQLDAERKAQAEAEENDAMVRAVRMRDFLALIHAAWHDYDSKDNPVWRRSPGQIGSMIGIHNLKTILPAVLRGAATAVQQDTDEREEEKAEAPRPTLRSVPKEAVNGGPGFGPSDEAILDLLSREPNSAA